MCAVHEVVFLEACEFMHFTLYSHVESQPSFFRAQFLLIA